MSEHVVDVLVRARENALQTLREVNEEIRRTGAVSQENIRVLQGVRREIVQKNRVLSTMRMYYQDQTQTLKLANDAFSAVASTVGKAQRMYEQYNTAMIRVAQLQENVMVAQQKYNDAVAKFGPSSQQATVALRELEKAQKDLATAQQQNTMMLLGFAAQLPAFIGNLDKIRVAFLMLKSQLEMTNATLSITKAELAAVTLGVTLAIPALYNLYSVTGDLQNQLKLSWIEAFNLRLAAVYLGKDLGELIDAIKRGTVDISSWGKGWANLQQKIRATSEASIANVNAILDQYRATKQQQEAIKAATEAYSQGKISIEEFTKRLLEQGVTGDEVLRTLMNTVAQVPKTFEEQLVGKAQQVLENFKNCTTGKFMNIKGDASRSMHDLIVSTNDLIKQGLLGQAQANIAAFVECSTSKQKTMVEQIDGYLERLRGEYDSNTKKITELTKQGKTKEAEIYAARNKEIQDKINWLLGWKQMVIDGAWKNIEKRTQESYDKLSEATKNGLTEMSVQWQQTTIAIREVWSERLGEMEDRTQLAVDNMNSMLARLRLPGQETAPTTGGGAYPPPALQHGGIVTRPTLALLGERGPEAVVPLGRGMPTRTDVQVYVTISSLHVSDEDQVQKFFQRLERKIVTAVRETK